MPSIKIGTNGTKPKDVISSVERALDIMELLASHPHGLIPKKIALYLDLHLSTCYHQLNTLLAKEYVVRDPHTTAFKLSHKVVIHPCPRRDPAQLVKFLNPHLHSLQEETEETSYLSVWDAGEIYIADIVQSPQSIQVKLLHIGYNEANHAMAIGKALLAYLEPTTLNHYVDQHPLIPYTSHTITDKAVLIEHLHRVAHQGYSLDLEERLPDIYCIGVPIFNAHEQVVASLGITVPKFRFHANFDLLLQHVIQVGQAATRALALHGRL